MSIVNTYTYIYTGRKLTTLTQSGTLIEKYTTVGCTKFTFTKICLIENCVIP